MSPNRLMTVAVAALLLITGVAALGAAVPADQAHDDATDDVDTPGVADNLDRADESAAADNGADNDGIGPSGGLPEQVPEHVHAIHNTIESFLGGTIDNLGTALSDLLGSDDAAEAGNDRTSDL